MQTYTQQTVPMEMEIVSQVQLPSYDWQSCEQSIPDRAVRWLITLLCSTSLRKRAGYLSWFETISMIFFCSPVCLPFILHPVLSRNLSAKLLRRLCLIYLLFPRVSSSRYANTYPLSKYTVSNSKVFSVTDKPKKFCTVRF